MEIIFKVSVFLCFISIVGLYFYFSKKNQIQKYKFVLPVVFFVFLFSGFVISNFIENKIIQQLVLSCFLLLSNVATFFVVSKKPADRIIVFIKKYYKFIVVIPFAISLLFSVVFFSDFCGENFNKFEDTNGDSDYSLQSIDAEMISSLQSKSTAIQVTESTKGMSSGMTSHQRYDYDEIIYSSSELHGVHIIQATKVSSDEIVFNVDNVVGKGNCQISLVVDGAIIHNFDINRNSTYHLKESIGKEAFIVLAGENADIKLSVLRNSNTN